LAGLECGERFAELPPLCVIHHVLHAREKRKTNFPCL
jgi:hypothetical protein